MVEVWLPSVYSTMHTLPKRTQAQRQQKQYATALCLSIPVSSNCILPVCSTKRVEKIIENARRGT